MRLAGPPTEEERVAAVHAYLRVLPAKEDALASLVKLAISVLGLPTVVIGLCDETHVRMVIGEGISEMTMPRQLAFCDYVIASGAPLVVRNALDDERFSNHALVAQNPGIRFYAGVPLKTRADAVVGVFCVSDTQPRVFTSAQENLLLSLATIVMERLDAEVELQEVVAAGAITARQARELEHIFDTMNEGVLVHDVSGKLVAANRAAWRMMGIEPNEERLVDRLMSLPLVAESGQPLALEERPPRLALSTGRDIENMVVGVKHETGAVTWFRACSVLNRNTKGSVESVFTTFGDVTALIHRLGG